MEKVHVFGHRKPDTDSICSAIAYANFKGQTCEKNYIPYRLGEINKETKFVLDYFNVKEPEFLSEITIRVRDLKLHKPHIISKETPIKKVWEMIKTLPNSKLIPILDDFNKIEGIATLGDIADHVLDAPNMDIALKNEILFENLVNCIQGSVNNRNFPTRAVKGRIIVGASFKDDELDENDIVVTNRKEKAEELLKNSALRYMLLTDGQKIDIETDKFVITTDLSLYKVVTDINQSVSVSSIMRNDNVMMIYANQKVDEVKEILHSSSHRNFPVIDADEHFMGILSSRHLIYDIRKEVILVDHNEKGQSVVGLENAKINEIIDHHRISDLETDLPLLIRSEPVGCTSTLIYKLYRENIIPISKEIAGIMLGAILSDTLILTSSTCTSEDVNAAERLATIADIDLKDFGQKMFEASTSIEGLSATEILEIDSKLFVIGKSDVYISQVNTLKLNDVLTMKDDLHKAMIDFCKSNKAQLCILLVTDIYLGGSEIIVAGSDMKYARKAFGISENEYSIYLSGVTSRKKQIVPKLDRVIKQGM
ncbi:MAG: putative manganese-dependent inorganic diphosphatase [Lachnospirales bacterium]